MLEDLPIQSVVASLGAVLGLIFGYVGRITRFCTLSAVETALYGDHWVQMRMWVFAIAVAVLGTLALVEFDLIDLSDTVHMLPRVAIAGPIFGGLIFGRRYLRIRLGPARRQRRSARADDRRHHRRGRIYDHPRISLRPPAVVHRTPVLHPAARRNRHRARIARPGL